jgi:hypothetical protein
MSKDITIQEGGVAKPMSNVSKTPVSQGIRARTVAEGMGMESVTLAQWLDTIGGII